MTEKRYVVKHHGLYYRKQYDQTWWTDDISRALLFMDVGEILQQRNWSNDGELCVVEIERVPQPKWREVREL